MERTGPIDVQVATGKSGIEFLVWPTQARGRPLLIPRHRRVAELRRDGQGYVGDHRVDPRPPLHVEDPASARVRKGTQLLRAPSAEANAAPAGKVGLYFNRRPQSGQGTTEISWNLQLQSSSPPTSRAPIRLAEPFFATPSTRRTCSCPCSVREVAFKLDRAPRCGRIVNGPAFDEVGSPLLLGTDSFASFEKVEAAHTRYLPGLGAIWASRWRSSAAGSTTSRAMRRAARRCAARSRSWRAAARRRAPSRSRSATGGSSAASASGSGPGGEPAAERALTGRSQSLATVVPREGLLPTLVLLAALALSGSVAQATSPGETREVPVASLEPARTAAEWRARARRDTRGAPSRPAARCGRCSTPPPTGCGWRRSSARAPRHARSTTSRCLRSSRTRRRSAATRRGGSARSGRASTHWRRSTSRPGIAGSRRPGARGTPPASPRESGWPPPGTTSRSGTRGC